MTPEKFERICRASRLVPQDKVETPQGVIYVAEGYFNTHAEFDRPHFKTIWAVARGELDISQPLYFEFQMGMPDKAQRIAKAVETAREFLNGYRH